jgi:hypothetical protein
MIEIPLELILEIINNTDFLDWISLLIKNVSYKYYIKVYIHFSNNILFIKIYDKISLLSS